MRGMRAALGKQMIAVLESEGPAAAADWLQAWLDTWPLAALSATARDRWQDHHDGVALAVLTRRSEILTMLGESPMPLMLPEDLPPHRVLTGAQLVADRAAVCRVLIRGEIQAAVITDPLPELPAYQLAVGELRLEGGPAQASVLRYGRAGLLAPGAPAFTELLSPPPPGQPGPRLRQLADAMVLPGTVRTLRAGRVVPTGWLLWEGPVTPIPVKPVAVELLRALSAGLQEASAALSLTTEQASEILDELVAVGALTASS
ncbi:MAG: hypothetical protein ACI8RZ_005638 [Myxococcota bacterium]|jgi:hypothetical protein